MRVNLQPAYILHNRPYRDSSVILEVFTPEYGRVSAVARGARRSSRGGRSAALIQLFTPLLVSFTGRGDLKTISANEAAGSAYRLQGCRLFSGLYVNELLVRLLHRHDAHPQLFATYGVTLEALAGEGSVEAALRQFELILLDELGYSFDLRVDGRSGEAVREDGWYNYHAECGLVEHVDSMDRARPAYPGVDLIAMASGEMGGAVAGTAKRLMREALASHLGGVPLKSRELFRSLRRVEVRGEEN